MVPRKQKPPTFFTRVFDSVAARLSISLSAVTVAGIEFFRVTVYDEIDGCRQQDRDTKNEWNPKKSSNVPCEHYTPYIRIVLNQHPSLQFHKCTFEYCQLFQIFFIGPHQNRTHNNENNLGKLMKCL